MEHRSIATAIALGTLLAIIMVACDEKRPSDATDPGNTNAVQLTIHGGDNQSGPAGSMLPIPLSVQARDAGARPVAGATVRWFSNTGGSVSAATTVTDVNGIATIARTLGANAGVQTTFAALDGVPGASVVFTSIATELTIPAKLSITGGDNQVGEAGSVLPVPLSVLVTDQHERPMAGAVIRWLAAGGTVNATTTVTDQQGRATVTRKLGPIAGQHITHATLEGVSGASVMFTSIAQINGALQIERHPADPVTIPSDTVLTQMPPYRVIVRDYTGTPVSGVAVEWTVQGAGSLSNSITFTDELGIAHVVHTLGTRTQPENVNASVDGLVGSPINFFTNVVAGKPVALTIHSGNGQLGRVMEQLDQDYLTRSFDAHGNPTAAPSINWSVTAGGGTIIPRDNGSALHILGPDEGPQTVVAALTGSPAPPVVFSSRAVTAVVKIDHGPDYGYYFCYDTPTFVPSTVTVRTGRTVAWRWDPGCWVAHNITFEDDPNQPVSSPTQARGTHFRIFTAPMTVRFRCTIHSTSFTEGMVGTVTVQ